MKEWISIVLQLMFFSAAGYLIIEYANWQLFAALILLLWSNNLMVRDRYKEYFRKYSSRRMKGLFNE